MKSVIISLLAVCTAFAGTVTYTLELTPRDVVFIQKDGYTIVTLQSGVNSGSALAQVWTTEPGSPLLPVLSGNVLIPADAELGSMTITELEHARLGEGYRLYPVQPMRPLSEFNSVPFVEPNQTVYNSSTAYPAKRLSSIPAGSKAGFRIAGFLYCPFEYRPASGRLTLITKARIQMQYKENSIAAPVLTESQRDLMARDIAELVVNPKDISHMAPPVVAKDGQETDVVMFTSSSMAPNLTGLRSWLMRKGYFTEIVTVDTISQTGRDTQEKMRNLLKKKFANEGLKYVILTGDVQHCPFRYGYLPYSTYNIPADMYFGDLDGDWDANGNSKFGEMTGDSVDLFHDIYVGRLPLDDADDAANFLKKDTTYEIVPDTGYLNNVLLPAEVLWSNIDFHGMIVNTNILRALNSRSTWEVDSGINMGTSNVITAVNNGTQLFHFAGHGSNTAFGSTFRTSNIPSLTNIAKPHITMSMACNCGWFDHASTECLGEEFVNATNGGAVSTMFNARYGWGAPPTQGPNSNMNCQFYNNFLKGMTQGKAHGLAKDFLRNESFSQMTMRWAMYTNTLQGDPTMQMWREVPENCTVTAPDTLAAMPQVVTVTVEKGDGPLANARVAFTHLGELIARGVTNSRGIAYVPVPAIEDTWTLSMSVTGQDAWLQEKTVYTTTGDSAPLVTYHHYWVDDANGRLDPGDTVPLYLVVKNKGNKDADSIYGYLTTYSPYITLLDTQSSYGPVVQGDTAKGDAYQVVVDPLCPHGHSARFLLTVTSAHSEWKSQTELIIGLPHANAGHWAIHDTGDYCLAVCANGGIGTTQWRGEGFGFIYPKDRLWSSSALMHGSLIIGTDTSWVCDNYYGAPSWKVCPLDFAMEESLRQVYPPELGDKEFLCTFSDADHPEPRNISIDHRSYGSANPNHQDFVILEYRIHNNGTEPLAGLYTAVAGDFRTANWNANDQFDYAGTDSLRNLAYVKSSPETLALGIRHIYPAGMNGYANCINHNTHINNGFTKTEKMKFMDGRLRQTTGTSQANWHAMSSSGPYTIPAGDSQIVAYVICGGQTVNELLTHSDTAAAWYGPPVGISGFKPSAVLVKNIRVFPKLFSDQIKVRYQLPEAEPLTITAYDAAGREAARCNYTPITKTGIFTWQPRVAPGVYFIRAGGFSDKVLKIK